ncbi:MAG TPA: alpha/beta hydrolase [Acidobacteriota bacterium]|nr:alpha/beta hydrolase [Acidobacteriota bacterium]
MKISAFCAVTFLFLGNAWVLGQRSMEQDPNLNNLVHPEGYKPSPPGTFGHVEKRGEGPVPMILIPGRGFDWSVFESFMQRNRKAYTMYAVTLAGMGMTAAPPMPSEGTSYGERTWINGAVKALKELIRKEGLERPVIVGHFLEGTQVVLEMALERPESVGSVIILGGIPRNRRFDSATLEQRIGYLDTQMAPKWFKTVTAKTWNDNSYSAASYSNQPDVAERLLPIVTEDQLQVHIRYLLEGWAGDVGERFSELEAPMLVLMPTFSQEFKKAQTNNWPDLFFVESWKGTEDNPRIEKKFVPEAHISVWLDNPQFVDDAIEEFLDKQK